MRNSTSFPDYLYKINQAYCQDVPSVKQSEAFVDSMIDLLFPFRARTTYTTKEIGNHLELLENELGILLKPFQNILKLKAGEISKMFFDQVPEIYRKLLKDAEAFTKFDPASESIEEIILCYPGFFSIATYRLAHVLVKLGVPILPRVMTEFAHRETGVDIHPGAIIGDSFFIDHGTGTVIGETAVIGDNVNIASRLCSAAKKGQVMIAGSVYRKVKNNVTAEGPYKIKVKGKDKYQVVYILKEIKP